MVQVTARMKDGCGAYISYYCHHNLECGYRYLVEKHLCGRTPIQTFIQADKDQVRKICGTSGKRVENGGNLCISKSDMRVYDVKSRVRNGQCIVINVTEGNHRIVLACNKVSHTCLPVHYEKWTNQRAGRQDCNKS